MACDLPNEFQTTVSESLYQSLKKSFMGRKFQAHTLYTMHQQDMGLVAIECDDGHYAVCLARLTFSRLVTLHSL